MLLLCMAAVRGLAANSLNETLELAAHEVRLARYSARVWAGVGDVLSRACGAASLILDGVWARARAAAAADEPRATRPSAVEVCIEDVRAFAVEAEWCHGSPYAAPWLSTTDVAAMIDQCAFDARVVWAELVRAREQVLRGCS
jgi:hypothetical protein